MNISFSIIILIFSAIIHEYMHGWMANELGDSTAKDAGRLTLNPLVHIDPWGSVLLPVILLATGSPFIFGYAKPVPYNPHNLSDSKFGAAKVAAAGPLSNLAVAICFGLILRFLPMISPVLAMFFQTIVVINLVLMVINLLPIPPLDGSKIIFPFLPQKAKEFYSRLEQYGIVIALLAFMLFFPMMSYIVNALYWLIVLA